MEDLISRNQIIDGSKTLEYTCFKPGIYFLIHEGVISYIGQSKSIGSRIGQHFSQKKIPFSRTFWIEIEDDNKRKDFEAEYIYHFCPQYNKHLDERGRVMKIKKVCKKFPQKMECVIINSNAYTWKQ